MLTVFEDIILKFGKYYFYSFLNINGTLLYGETFDAWTRRSFNNKTIPKK